MESLCENQNSQSSDIMSEIKALAQEDNANASKKEGLGQGDNFCNEILDQNTLKENSKETSGEVGYEANNSIGDGASAVEAESKRDGEKETAILDVAVEKGILNEENTDLTENKSLEDTEKGDRDSDVRKSGDSQDEKNDEPSNTVEELQDVENFSISNDDQESQAADIIADQDLQDEHVSLNEATNMDVEETGSITTNAEQEACKEDEKMNLDGKDKEVSISEMPDKVTEGDLEEHLSQDDEVCMNPSESNANPMAEEESSMNVSEEAECEQSMDGEDQDMQMENTEKDGGETMDVSMANVDIHGGGDESMEVASPSDQDPIGLMNDLEVNEQMDVNESLDESGKPEDEMEDRMKNDETGDNSKQMVETDESTKQAESEDSTTNQSEGNESVAKEKDSEHAEGSDKPEGKESIDDNVESKVEEAPFEKEKVVGEAEESGSGETADEVKENLETALPDKDDTDTTEGDSKALNEVCGKDKDEEELCIIPDTVLKVGGKDGDKSDEKDSQENSHTISEKSAVTEVAEKPKPTRKSSNAEKRSESSYIAPVEPVVEYRHSRPQRQAAKRAETQIKELAEEDSNSNEGFGDGLPDDVIEVDASTQMCFQCCRLRTCRFQVYVGGKGRYLCQEECYNAFRKHGGLKSRLGLMMINDKGKPGSFDPDRSFIRKCSQCSSVITGDEKNLSWETMDFCSEECLGKYQTALGSHCANCKGSVQPVSLGKYCVRFGYDIKQFCCSTCLEEFKKGLKVCSYCQKDISSGVEGFLAPVGDKGQFKDFCTQACMEKYDQMSNNQPPPVVMHQCAVCNNEKVVKVEVILDNKLHKLCSEPCFAAFKFVNKVNADHCDMCKKYFDKSKTEIYSVYYDDAPHSFCCKTCMNVYILANRKIVPCNWCKVKKYNFDMIKRVTANGQVLMMCSLNCLTLYQVSVNAVSSKRIKCDLCNSVAQAQYHLTMSDATIRNFCSYQCVMSFQGQYSKNAPISFSGNEPAPIPTATNKTAGTPSLPVISNVTSLATPNGQQVPSPNSAGITTRSSTVKVNNNNNNNNIATPQSGKTTPMMYKQQVIVKPPSPKQMRNKSVLCKPYMHTKGVSCRPHPCTKETQTEDTMGKKVLIPVPVPIYVPAPMHMYSSPYPVPVPFPLPVPVPIFIPTTRNSAHGIMKEIKRIQEKIPTDPFEAELLMMAEMVAGEKKGDNSDSDSDDGGNGAGDVSEVPGGSSAAEGGFSPEAVDTSNTFGEDMLQMALKMASELEEPAVDLEAALTPSTITAQSQTSMEQNDATESEVDDPEPVQALPETRANRGRKRGVRSTRGVGSVPSKRGRRISSSVDIPLLPPPEPQPPPRVEQEKPDANMCLKYTFGVNAWRQWVMAKNAELEKAASNNRKLKLFKPEILQLTADELNYSLCLFVKEVRKPNGSEYAPDTIYYLCLGIQQYLFENGRIDNIFTDSYYDVFTECLDEVAKKFTALYNDSQYIVTRVEEEHLWESKQLGAHSPHVLLSTLMFFNTKHFNLTTVEEHMQLSFSHIMKHWKRNPNQPGVTKVPGSSRNVLLRFYPPQSALEANARKKKVYEQQENEENPLRCPVKLYEFYLSKCPESVKTRNDVFYLLPERSCVPDSPVWYSTMALGKEPLIKMLHRVKMVKEINIALLTS
ncbi:zinc finger MYM-type protein 4 isoform X3 [Zootermopsis nevadensis]|uniref:zinc finger MYM-type protein 4 isoform X3 n=1 Tax=Zootermopsis nevadensis TaxID=136037 RepID=UPI000B8E83A5|nr:zinc finger MYM-type protein 4 isoform X3 [Zootermopsis nevadensis]